MDQRVVSFRSPTKCPVLAVVLAVAFVMVRRLLLTGLVVALFAADPSPTSKINPRDGLRYIWIPPGVYAMGCSPGDTRCFSWEPRTHRVKIARGFWIGETEVTQGVCRRETGWGEGWREYRRAAARVSVSG